MTFEQRNLPSLTGLRWLGAMLVFGFHVGTMHVIADPHYARAIAEVFTLGLSGVQFFYMLSGFVLVWSARPGESRRRFWRRRIAKIYPNHVAMWAVAILIGLYWTGQQDPWVAVANLFLVQAWVPSGDYYYSVNNVSWSLACEAFFYLCLPLALPVIRRMRTSTLYGAIVALPLLILSLWPGQTLLPESVDHWWFAQVFPLVRSLEFWMGVAAAELMVRGKWHGPNLWWSTSVFVLTWVAASQWIRAELWAALLAVAYVLLITAAANADVTGAWSPWRSRPMRWLGEVSFAFYLVHVLVTTNTLRYLNRSGGLSGWHGPAAVVGFLVLNLFLAWLLFRFVETPMVRLLRPRPRKGRRETAPDRRGQEPAGDAQHDLPELIAR